MGIQNEAGQRGLLSRLPSSLNTSQRKALQESQNVFRTLAGAVKKAELAVLLFCFAKEANNSIYL